MTETPAAGTINETGEPADAEAAVRYWRGRWADSASALADVAGLLQDIAEHANPIASDEDGFVVVGYTVTVGAIHRALGWLRGRGALPQDAPGGGDE